MHSGIVSSARLRSESPSTAPGYREDVRTTSSLRETEKGSIATLLVFTLTTAIILAGSVREIRILTVLQKRVELETETIGTLSQIEQQLSNLLRNSHPRICTSDASVQYAVTAQAFKVVTACTPARSYLEYPSEVRFFSCRWSITEKSGSAETDAIQLLDSWLSTRATLDVWLPCPA